MNYTIIAPPNSSESELRNRKVLFPFEDAVLNFIDSLSTHILTDKQYRRYPELMAMAFWMRKPNILQLKAKFETHRSQRVWLGRGVVFHIAPSNVDTIFIYSWFLSMLVGNLNIVRLSSNTDEQLLALIHAINSIAEKPEHKPVVARFLIVQYEHNDEITAHLSSFCDVRVIWGGDETVRRMRAVPLKPTATELVFADKFSLSVLAAEPFLRHDKKDALINSFFNDAYWFGQNACSSPRLVVWLGLGDKVETARTEFWKLVEQKVKEKLGVAPPSVAVNKLVAIDSLVIQASGEARIESSQTTLLDRVMLASASDIRRDLHCGGGLFYELRIAKLDDLAEVISAKDQTVGSFGVSAEDWRNFIMTHRPEGINRVVPIGEALNFSAIWDGYDLLREFCREVDVAL